MRRFTVYDVLAVGKCERKLWLETRGDGPRDATREIREPLPIQAAKALWPGCVEIGSGENAAQDTLFAIASGAKALCGAVGVCGSLEYRADALVRGASDEWTMYIDGNSVHTREPLAREAAFAMLVFAERGVRVASVKVLLVNPEYVRGEEVDWRSLYREADITDRAFSHQKAIATHAARVADIASLPQEPSCQLLESCLKPRECPCWPHCSASLPSPNVFSIAGVSNRRKFQLYRTGVVSYEDCLEFGKLSRSQSAQVLSELQNEPPRVDKRAVRVFLNSLWYPMCFLDFESFQPHVPPYEGLRPFEQTAFQYSLHIRMEQGGSLTHHVFLAEPGMDPRPKMAESLARSIPKGACVVVYSSGLEKRVLMTLANRFPEHREALFRQATFIRDLIVPFRSRAYYAKAMRGSCSLKSVLPAMCPDLSYTSLEGVHNGEDAMRAYVRLCAMPEGEREPELQKLIAYCSLDTYAMVRILDALYAAV